MIRRLPIVPTLLVAIAVAVMVALGVWQLGRAEEKRALLDRYERARFGGQTPTEAERDAARRDLARIREAWR